MQATPCSLPRHPREPYTSPPHNTSYHVPSPPQRGKRGDGRCCRRRRTCFREIEKLRFHATSPPSSKTNSPTSTTVTYLGAFNYSNAPQQLIHPLHLLVHVKPTSWNSRCPSKVFRSNRLAGGRSLIRKSSLKKCHTGPD